MSNQHTGWFLFLAGLGMMFGLLAVDVTQLREWGQMTTPIFIGTAMGHLAATITAFVGGKLLPPDPMMGGRRSSDPKE